MIEGICPICKLDGCKVALTAFQSPESGTKAEGFYSGNCKTCGQVCVSIHFVNDKVETNKIDRSDFLGYLKSHSTNMERSGKLQAKPIRTRNDLEEGIIRPSTPLEQVDMLIEYIASKQKSLSEFVRFDSSKDYPICFAKNESDFCFIVKSAYELKLINGRGVTGGPVMSSSNRLHLTDELLALTLKGWERFHELQKQSPYSKQVFVAFNFDKDRKMKRIYDRAVAPAISEFGLIPYTTLDDEHGNSITDVIIANIRKSRFIIADVTNASQNVYYEAGFAYGLGLEVILTCHDESAETDMKFDTSHIKHVLWKDEEDLKTKLINRIEALGLSLKT